MRRRGLLPPGLEMPRPAVRNFGPQNNHARPWVWLSALLFQRQDPLRLSSKRLARALRTEKQGQGRAFSHFYKHILLYL